MIEAIDLTVRRRGRAVLDAVSFDVRPGQVTGVLGGTGAGKTTLLRRMVQLDRGGGETLFEGRPYRALVHPMREVGLVLEDAAGYPDHTVRGHLRLVLATDRRAAVESGVRGWLRRAEQSGGHLGQSGEGVLAVRDAEGNRISLRSGMAGGGGATSRVPSSRGNARRGRMRPTHRIDAVLDIVGLSGQGRTRIADLTNGMATRLAIAAALLGDPMALLLDCPDRGLEPEGVAWLGDLLRAFTGQGRAALVTCADTETVARLSDRILLLDSGYLVGTRTSEEVLRAPAGAAVIVRSPQIVRFAALLAEAGARSSQGEGASLEVRGLDRARIGDLAYRHGVPLHELAERFTGTDPGDFVLAACSSRGRAVVPLQTVTRPAAGVGVDARRGVKVGAGAGAASTAGSGAGAPGSVTALGDVPGRVSGAGAGAASTAGSGVGAAGLVAAVADVAGHVSGPDAGAVSTAGAGAVVAEFAGVAGHASGAGVGVASTAGSGAGAASTAGVGAVVAEFAGVTAEVPRPSADAVGLGAEPEGASVDASSQHVDGAESVAATSESDADA